MRGPIWNDPNVGVTGEPIESRRERLREKTENFEIYEDEDGQVRTRMRSGATG